MSLPPEPPVVRGWAAERAAARAARDFAAADALRARIEAAGWQVRDTPEGWQLAPRPPYPVVARPGDLPDRSGEADSHPLSVALLVEGWPQDLRACVAALLRHAPAGTRVLGLDLGNVDGAGDALHELAGAYPERVQAWHLAGSPGWGEGRRALLRLDTAAVHVVMETSTLLEGDALTPLLAALADPGVVAAGWQGVVVAPDWRSFTPAGAGEVHALLGYLFAVRRRAALDSGGPDRRARFYRNADLEWGLALRAAGGRLVAVPDLPVRQTRHRGFHDSDPAYRERESRRTYDRLLRRFRDGGRP